VAVADDGGKGWRGLQKNLYATVEGFLPETNYQQRQGVVVMAIRGAGGRREVKGRDGKGFLLVMPIEMSHGVISSIWVLSKLCSVFSRRMIRWVAPT
jgi:hypothetical protein